MQTLTVRIRSAIENGLCYMADLTKVVIACCAKESFIHSNNALMFCHNTALQYVFSEKNYLGLCLCTLLCNVVYTEELQLPCHTCTATVPHFNIPLYTSSAYTHSSQVLIILGCLSLTSSELCQLELRELSSDVSVVLEKEIQSAQWFWNKRFIFLVFLE